MGAHHYKLEVVPRQFIEKFPNPIPMEFVYEGLQPWFEEKPDNKFLESLRILLPIDKSWGVEEYVSANDWGSDIRIWKEDEIIENIVFRYSKIDDWDLMISFLNIVRESDYVLVGRKGYIIEPEEKEIRNDFRNSAVGQFKNDPVSAIIRAAEAATEFDKLGKKEKFNDQFRMPGSKYEYDEPVAFLTLSKGEEIDWANIDFKYIYDFLYITRIIFEEIVKKAQELDLNCLKNFKLYKDERFSGDILFKLLSEIDKIKESIEDQDVLKAIELIIEKIEKCISSTELELAFEGY
jgi:hypothetical protein